MNSATEVHEAHTRLRERGVGLRERDSQDVIDVLASVFDRWHDASSPWRQRLERELPAASGFDPAVVREGTTRALQQWTGDALRELISRELGRYQPFCDDEQAAPIALGFETSALVLAGAIPMPTLLAVLLPLVLRSPVLVKTAARDPITAQLVADSVREQDSQLADCIEVVCFARDDESCTRALLEAPCVVAYGSDSTMESLRNRMGAGQRMIAYGHRMSIALLGDEATQGDTLEKIANGLALDTALWDQLGCLSPVAVLVEDVDGKACGRVATALAEALEAAGKRWPRGELSTEVAAAIVQERSRAQMRAASDTRCVLHAGAQLGWTVVAEADAQWRPAPLHRFLRVHPFTSERQLGDTLSQLSPHLTSVALAGFGDREGEMRSRLSRVGVSRVCAPGQMQTPPIGWHHEGGSVLTPLARLPDQN